MPYLDRPKLTGGASRMPLESTSAALFVGLTVGGAGLFIVVASLLGLVTPEPGVPRWLPAWIGGVFLPACRRLLSFDMILT